MRMKIERGRIRRQRRQGGTSQVDPADMGAANRAIYEARIDALQEYYARHLPPEIKRGTAIEQPARQTPSPTGCRVLELLEASPGTWFTAQQLAALLELRVDSVADVLKLLRRAGRVRQRTTGGKVGGRTLEATIAEAVT